MSITRLHFDRTANVTVW